MTGKELQSWAVRWEFDGREAADAIGIGRSTYYRHAAKPIVPESIRLATVGFDAERQAKEPPQ